MRCVRARARVWAQLVRAAAHHMLDIFCLTFSTCASTRAWTPHRIERLTNERNRNETQTNRIADGQCHRQRSAAHAFGRAHRNVPNAPCHASEHARTHWHACTHVPTLTRTPIRTYRHLHPPIIHTRARAHSTHTSDYACRQGSAFRSFHDESSDFGGGFSDGSSKSSTS